jgi:predicted Zn-dependent protease
MRLTEQGRILLQSGNPSDAIRVLERAVSLNPTNGQNYYYLSEAWLLKGNPSQAKEFNHLAYLYLKEDPEWLNRVIEQREHIIMRSK